jgi:hypothetical protein
LLSINVTQSRIASLAQGDGTLGKRRKYHLVSPVAGYRAGVTTWDPDGGVSGERADPDEREAVVRDQRRRDDDEQVVERREVEWAATSWHDLVVGSVSREVSLRTVTGSEVVGVVADVGDGWCQVDRPGRTAVVLLDRVAGLRADLRVSPGPAVQPRLGSVLRRWARFREPVSVELVDAESVTGLVSHVLADALTVVAPTGPDGEQLGGEPVTVPFAAIVCVHGPGLRHDL